MGVSSVTGRELPEPLLCFAIPVFVFTPLGKFNCFMSDRVYVSFTFTGILQEKGCGLEGQPAFGLVPSHLTMRPSEPI